MYMHYLLDKDNIL